MDEQQLIASLGAKLKKLNELDSGRSLFGADWHQYHLGPPSSEQEIRKFEMRFGISLPNGYRLFLLEIGNGGAGPYYGLETLEESLYVDLDYKRPNELLDPSRPFRITEPWNMEFEGDPDNEREYEQFEEEYFADRWIDGLLRLCNYGCGVSMNLVVNGPEYGNIWVDDRGNDGGIYPDPYFGQEGRTGFLDWYCLWLDLSIAELREKER